MVLQSTSRRPYSATQPSQKVHGACVQWGMQLRSTQFNTPLYHPVHFHTDHSAFMVVITPCHAMPCALLQTSGCFIAVVGNERRNILLREFYAFGLQRVSSCVCQNLFRILSCVCALVASFMWGVASPSGACPVLQDDDLQPLKTADPVQQQRPQPNRDPPPASPKRQSQHYDDDRQRAKQPRLSAT